MKTTPMFHKRHYLALSTLLLERRPKPYKHSPRDFTKKKFMWDMYADDMLRMLILDNPKFDSKKFNAAIHRGD